jgi:hypothetical protein
LRFKKMSEVGLGQQNFTKFEKPSCPSRTSQFILKRKAEGKTVDVVKHAKLGVSVIDRQTALRAELGFQAGAD